MTHTIPAGTDIKFNEELDIEGLKAALGYGGIIPGVNDAPNPLIMTVPDILYFDGIDSNQRVIFLEDYKHVEPDGVDYEDIYLCFGNTQANSRRVYAFYYADGELRFSGWSSNLGSSADEYLRSIRLFQDSFIENEAFWQWLIDNSDYSPANSFTKIYYAKETDLEGLNNLRRELNPLVASTETEMNELVDGKRIGMVLKYTGKTNAYEKDNLYLVENNDIGYIAKGTVLKLKSGLTHEDIFDAIGLEVDNFHLEGPFIYKGDTYNYLLFHRYGTSLTVSTHYCEILVGNDGDYSRGWPICKVYAQQSALWIDSSYRNLVYMGERLEDIPDYESFINLFETPIVKATKLIKEI